LGEILQKRSAHNSIMHLWVLWQSAKRKPWFSNGTYNYACTMKPYDVLLVKKRIGEVCVLLYGVNFLQSCSILSKVKLLTCPLLLSLYCFLKSGLLENVVSSKFLLLCRPTGWLFLSSTWNAFLVICCDYSGINSYSSLSHFENITLI
jgi:hypothetical protein